MILAHGDPTSSPLTPHLHMEAVEGGLLLGFMVVVFTPIVRRELRSPASSVDRLGRERVRP